MEALGIGSSVRKLTVDNLAEALRVATTDQKQVDRARLVGEAIRAVRGHILVVIHSFWSDRTTHTPQETGVKNAVEAIYRDLEYARTLIKHPSRPASLEAIPKHSEEQEKPTRVGIASPRSSFASAASASGSTEWSVISGDENGGPKSSRHSSDLHSSPSSKRSSRVPGFSAIQDAFSIHRSSSRKSNAGHVRSDGE